VSEELAEQLDRELARFHEEVAAIDDADALYELSVRYVGKKGSISRLKGGMGALAPEDRKAFGQAFNRTKQAVQDAIAARRDALAAATRKAELGRIVDLTMSPEAMPLGSLHPITRTRLHLEEVFRTMGFDVEDGPHVEDEQYNFDDLNIPSDHPARDMQDTFFVRGREQPAGESGLVLRTHTSPVQVRTMLRRKPPIRIVALGTVFRRDDDATHSPMFHQIEGLRVDDRVSMADLKATLFRFVSAFFGTSLEVRFRPSFFPFVEPGAEFDIQCPFCSGSGCTVCKGSGFIELGGAGMVHPNVFSACGIDPEAYTGWAFGFGIDRMACLLHGVPDLRLLFEGDIRFLEQFPC
jgi:phenylalanyl-tRNA synthetase alpha chain